MKQRAYSGSLKFYGAQHRRSFIPANNYAAGLVSLKRFKQAKALLRKTMPVVRRVLGEGCDATLIMRLNYATALYEDPAATDDDLREAVTTLEEIEATARRVLGGSYPTTVSTVAAKRTRAPPRRETLALQTADDLAAHFVANCDLLHGHRDLARRVEAVSHLVSAVQCACWPSTRR